MKIAFLVASREFKSRVRQRSFLIMTLALPIIVVIGLLVSRISTVAPDNNQDQLGQATADTVEGIVDQAGVIQQLPEDIPPDRLEFFDDSAEAGRALESGRIEAYYEIPPDYLATGEVRRISLRLPNSPPETETIQWLLLFNISQSQGFEEAALLREPFGPAGIQYVDLASENRTSSDSPVPMFAAIIILAPLFVNGGLLFQSLASEKEGRVLEILLASIKPRDLLVGKMFGVMALMLLQYLIWGLMALLAITFVSRPLDPVLAALNFSQFELVLVVVYTFGGFMLYAGLMAGIGALAPDTESSRAWLFVVTLPMTIPIYIGASIAADPQGLISVILSLFPPSAPVTMLMRMAGSAVPGWQIASSVSLLLVSVVFTLWLMARLFRAQTLLSGEPLSLGRFWQAVRIG